MSDENNESTARLLIDLHSNGLKSIQLLGHFDYNEAADYTPARDSDENSTVSDREDPLHELIDRSSESSRPIIAGRRVAPPRPFNSLLNSVVSKLLGINALTILRQMLLQSFGTLA